MCEPGDGLEQYIVALRGPDVAEGADQEGVGRQVQFRAQGRWCNVRILGGIDAVMDRRRARVAESELIGQAPRARRRSITRSRPRPH